MPVIIVTDSLRVIPIPKSTSASFKKDSSEEKLNLFWTPPLIVISGLTAKDRTPLKANVFMFSPLS
ncbi:hypothetical protein M2G70_08140 [Vibrio vulnificus]|nr:hypothetical protein [Vibrio vulnificus]